MWILFFTRKAIYIIPLKKENPRTILRFSGFQFIQTLNFLFDSKSFLDVFWKSVFVKDDVHSLVTYECF